MALKKGVLEAKPALLEPIMTIEVRVPEEYMGDVNRDLNTRRGRVLGMDTTDGMQVVHAHVPQAELFSYATELRSITGGRGTFTLDARPLRGGAVAPRREGHRGPPQGNRGGRRQPAPRPRTWREPDAGHLHPAHTADRLRLGGDERGRRRAVRPAGRIHRPVRPEHGHHAAGAGGAAGPVGHFEVPISEYPPSDYRRLVEAAAARYDCAPDELLVGAGADEILDLIGKAFIPPGGAAIVPTPSYAMFTVVTAQRGATVVAVPRLAADGFALDGPAIRQAAADGASVAWLCSPNNPTALPEPAGTVAVLLDGLAADAAAAGRIAPVVVLDEAYAEFVGESLAGLRFAYPRLVAVRTLSKAYALAGLRVGFALARPELIAEIAPYRPPGSVSVVSVAAGEAVLRDDGIAPAAVARISAERERFAAALTAAGWTVLPSTDQLPARRPRIAARRRPGSRRG